MDKKEKKVFKISAEIIKFDVPNKSNRIYKKELLKTVPDEVVILETMPKSGVRSISDKVIGIAKLSVKEDGIYGICRIIDIENNKKILEKIKKGYFSFRSFGIGNINKNNEITNFELQGVALTNNPS